MSVRPGSASLEVTQHAALRMTQRGSSIDAVESTLSQPSFEYFHQGAWKTGFYDPASRVFVGTVHGVVTTVIDNVSQNYINNLLRGSAVIKVTYDPQADAAYLHLVDEIGGGGVARTYPCDPSETGAMINLDFDASGRLVGIEVMDARKLLPEALLDEGS